MALVSGCAPQITDGRAIPDASDQLNPKGEAASNQSLPAPPQTAYPTTDHPTDHPGVGLGVPTHPPTDFSLIPSN